jgi:hypothetical protein
VARVVAAPVAVAGVASVLAATLRDEHEDIPMPMDNKATAIRDQCTTIGTTPRVLEDGILDVRKEWKLLD